MPSRTAFKLTAVTAALALGATACNGETGDGENGEAADVDPLQIGYVLPETGELAFLGPPQISAAELAIDEINEAGGIHGTEVPDMLAGDEADDAAQATEAANSHVADGVQAVLGAAASGMTQAIYDTVTGAEIVQCSGSNTAPDLSDIDDGGYYFRTAPSDLLAGPMMAQLIVDDGHQSVAIVNRADDYGEGYADALAEELENLGAEVTSRDSYDPDATNFDPLVSSVTDGDPDAVTVIAFEEGTQVLSGLFEGDVEGDQMYVTDGMNVDDLGERIQEDSPEVVSGVSGVAPGSDDEGFRQSIEEFDPDLESLQFAAQVYDCVQIIALSAEAAGSTDPTVYVDEMVNVTRDGTPCTGFAECSELLADGEDIDYQGASGSIEWDENGDPTTVTYEIFGFDEDGEQTNFGFADLEL